MAATGYIVASWYGNKVIAGSSKAVASVSFIVLAVVNEASATVYGRYILLALTLSMIGDLCLLSRKTYFLLAGIAAFFLAHIAFVVAFAQMNFEAAYLVVAIVCTTIAALLVLKWLWKYLGGVFRMAVPAYLLVMVVMVSLAVGVSGLSMVGIGAILFAVSDISVARDRFVSRDIVNKAWGLPLYYIAQLLFAASVIYAV